MIIKLFRSNQPALLLTVPFIGMVVWALHYFDQNYVFQPQGFLFKLFFEDYSIAPWIIKTIALSIICLTAIQLNNMLNEIEVFSKITHVSFLLTITFGSILSQRGGLEPVIISNFFMVLAMRSILKVYHQNSVIGLTFDAGLWVGIAVLFEPLYIICLISLLIGVLTLRAADWREILFLLIGAALPFSFLLAILFVLDITYVFPSYSLSHEVTLPYQNSSWFYAYAILTILLFLRSLLFYWVSMNGIALRIKKQRRFILYFSISLVAVYILKTLFEGMPFSNQILLLPTSFFLSFLVIHTTKSVFIDTLLYIITILWVIFVYNLYFQS